MRRLVFGKIVWGSNNWPVGLEWVANVSDLSYITNAGTSTFTTELDDLASECAPWAKTAATSLYTNVSALEGFCAHYSPTSTSNTPSGTPTPNNTSGKPSFGGGVSSPTATSPSTARTTVTSTSVPRPVSNYGAQTGASVLRVWTACVLSSVLSYFFLI